MSVFRLTSESGFFSILFRMCAAYLEVGPRLAVDSTRWNHGRWSRYFQSLHDNVPGHETECHTMTSVTDSILNWTLGDYRRALHDLLRLTPPLRMDVKRVLREIGRPFTSIFVRRGDKIVSKEAQFIPMSTILSWIPYTPDTVFFIQTDDYTVIEEARECLPGHRIVSTVPPTKRGSYHDRSYNQTVAVPWSIKTPEDAYTETCEMLVGLFVCLAAESCWTDDTSNVGRFLKLYDDRVHVYPTDYSVDTTLHANPAWTLRA
jgi:hypothetical protein